MSTAQKQRDVIVHDFVFKRQLEAGPNPQRYFHRYFRRRTRKFRNERTYRADSSSPTAGRKRGGKYSKSRSGILLEYEDISPLGSLNRITEDMLEKKWTAPDFLRRGWKGAYAPPGMRIPVTPKCRLVPMGYFTFREKQVRAKLDEKTKARKATPIGSIFTKQGFQRFLDFLSYWLVIILQLDFLKEPKIYTRVTDYNEHEILDLSKKNYQYFRQSGVKPAVKRKVPILYDGCTHSMYEKYLNLRKYNCHTATKYRYRQSYVILKPNRYRMWKSPKLIDKIRHYFLKFDRDATGFVTFENMCQVLDKLGNSSRVDIRKAQFDAVQNSGFRTELTPEGQIEFEEFLNVYYFLTYKQTGPNRGYPKERRLTPVSTSRKHLRKRRKSRKKRRRRIKTTRLPNSFRTGFQCPAIAAKYSVYWNLACGLF